MVEVMRTIFELFGFEESFFDFFEQSRSPPKDQKPWQNEAFFDHLNAAAKVNIKERCIQLILLKQNFGHWD